MREKFEKTCATQRKRVYCTLSSRRLAVKKKGKSNGSYPYPMEKSNEIWRKAAAGTLFPYPLYLVPGALSGKGAADYAGVPGGGETHR